MIVPLAIEPPPASPMAFPAGQGCLRELTQSLSVRHLMTPACELVGVAGVVSASSALALMRQKFDQLPVYAADRSTIIGLVTRQAAQEASEEATVCQIMTPLPQAAILRFDATLPQAMAALTDQPAVLVTSHDQVTIAGLLHYADFNRHPSRVFFYLWLSALEISLVKLLTSYFDEHQLELNDWLRYLPEPRQVNILGRYEVSRRQRVELTPLEGAELTDLLQLCRSIDGLRLQLGFRAKNTFDQATSHLIPLRNAAMHPVRSLLTSHDELPRLLDRYNNLESFVLLLEDQLRQCKAR